DQCGTAPAPAVWRCGEPESRQRCAPVYRDPDFTKGEPVLKTLIVEDSRLARTGLMRMLAQFPQLELVGAAEHAEQARELIAEHRPTLLFLDIHMPGETGFDLLESLDYEPRIIFTTAYSEYAIRSFDYQTVDYLLKPISQERLALAIEKLTSESKPQLPAEPPLELNNRIFVKDGDQCHLIE